MSHDDYAAEPDPSLPGQLPAGESILWQGKPDWLNLAWRVYHLREVTIYFGILMIWRGFSAWWETGVLAQAPLAVTPLLVPAALCALILGLMAWLNARTTVYTITDNRLVLKIGVALPTTFNLPFSAIGAAELRETGHGCGDIGVTLSGNDKLAYLMLWPHARPWRLMKPDPMLRCVPEAAKVAQMLSIGLHKASGQSAALAQAISHAQPDSRNQSEDKSAESVGGLTTVSR